MVYYSLDVFGFSKAGRHPANPYKRTKRKEFIPMKYDVIIIGAGPGGIFSAYELVQQNSDLKIAVFESGHPLETKSGAASTVRAAPS